MGYPECIARFTEYLRAHPDAVTIVVRPRCAACGVDRDTYDLDKWYWRDDGALVCRGCATGGLEREDNAELVCGEAFAAVRGVSAC